MDEDFARYAVSLVAFAKGNLDAAMNQNDPEQIHQHVESARNLLSEVLEKADEWHQSQLG